ncbi:unnamed protein product [Blepharisma stoltei]|uniref:Pirin n=1 Tax=Blepharisma stoltei TaxID=1481888 RepID=A0AAU9JPC2_9CILI|nr:unnamed protein product [Blepharisma stoltei]
MNLTIIFSISLAILVVSWYISEYTHFHHTPRMVTKIFAAELDKDSKSGKIFKVIGGENQNIVDPFLSFEHFILEKPYGFNDHPHRGTDKVTYIIGGEMIYEDFRGNVGALSAGDAMWMTSGKGMVHAEMPLSDTVEGVRVEILLKNDFRMCDPAYQYLKSDEIATAEDSYARVKVIAGESMGRASHTITRTPGLFLIFDLGKGGEAFQEIPQGWNAVIYVLQGRIEIQGDEIKARHGAVLSQWDNDLTVKSKKGATFILIAAEPMDEMMVQFGPYVMPNYPLVEKAHRDFKNGQDGFEGAPEWKSTIGKQLNQ